MTVAAPAKVFADRIGRIEVSATMAVAAEAAKLRAQGANLVDFGAGEPHFATPRHIKDAAIAAIEANFTRYTVVPGIPDVRKAIIERHACDFGSDYALDEAIFTTGGKLALFNTIQVLVDHGDEVILKPARQRASASPPTPSRRPSRPAPRPSFSTRRPIRRDRSSPQRISSASSIWPTIGAFIYSSTSAMSI